MVEVRDAQDVRPMTCAPRCYTFRIVVWTQVPVDLTNLLRLAYQVQGVIGSGKLDLSIWLCSEQAMLDLNITTRKKKKPTDVLSFRLLDVRSPGSRADASSPVVEPTSCTQATHAQRFKARCLVIHVNAAVVAAWQASHALLS